MISRNQAKLIRKLASRKHREARDLFLVEGVRHVEELLNASWPVELALVAPCLSETERGRALLDRMKAVGWKLADTSDRELERLAPTESPQGVLVVAVSPRRNLEEYEPAPNSTILIFDRLADPGNLGTLIRTAHALGVDWAVALPGTVDPWNPKAVRASAGSLFHLPVSRQDWESVVHWLRKHGFDILCADAEGEPVSRGARPGTPFALVLGNEPTGLSEATSGECDRRVAVSLPASVESLNVAIAGALLLDRLLDARPDRRPGQPAPDSTRDSDG